MDFLNKTFAQVKDLFQSMTPGARITAGLLLAVVVISLGYLFTHQVSGTDVYLMGAASFSASDLPAMEAAFAKAELNSYEIRGTGILIPRGQRDRYMAALADANALPPNIHEVLDEAIKDTSPFVGKQQREARLKAAKQKMLGMIIRSMQGIENAYVLYDEEEKRQFRREKVITASVGVKPQVSQYLDDSQISAIQHLVAYSIASTASEVRPPHGPRNLNVARLTSQLTPTTPMPLSPTAPIVPATWVPCPSSSHGKLSSS